MVPDVLPKLLIEIRDDPAVDAIVDQRVRGFEPAPGDVQEKGGYVAFVVLVQLDAPRIAPRIPAQRASIAARCYGRTPAEAASLRWAVSNAIHNLSPRTFANGLGIYLSTDAAGGEQDKDPQTQQPFQTLVIEAIATTQAVT